jgi:hypothetical protein
LNPDYGVIPAKAGIQSGGELRSNLWIPAFAGMTLPLVAAGVT